MLNTLLMYLKMLPIKIISKGSRKAGFPRIEIDCRWIALMYRK